MDKMGHDIMMTLFMTGGGGAGTIAATKFLKEKGRYKIILGDMDHLAPGAYFADEFHVIPKATDKDFIPAVAKIIQTEKVDVFIPLVDEEIMKSYSLKKDFPNLQILLPNEAFSAIVLDKYTLIKNLQKYKIHHPETYLSSESIEVKKMSYPVIVKPRVGRGSRNVMELTSFDQLEAYITLLRVEPDEIIVQEKLIGEEYTISVVADNAGHLLAVVPKKIICKRGITLSAVTVFNKRIVDLATEVQQSMGANGPFNMQLIVTKDGVPMIFEINPRYSTTIALTMAAGVDEISLLTENAISTENLAPFKTGLVMNRYYEQRFFDEESP